MRVTLIHSRLGIIKWPHSPTPITNWSIHLFFVRISQHCKMSHIRSLYGQFVSFQMCKKVNVCSMSLSWDIDDITRENFLRSFIVFSVSPMWFLQPITWFVSVKLSTVTKKSLKIVVLIVECIRLIRTVFFKCICIFLQFLKKKHNKIERFTYSNRLRAISDKIVRVMTKLL